MQSSKLSLSSSMLAGQPVRAPARLGRCLRRQLVTRAVAEPPTTVPFLSTADHLEQWSPESWRNFTALQQPAYPNQVLQLPAAHSPTAFAHFATLNGCCLQRW
jgi:hypothetical protein